MVTGIVRYSHLRGTAQNAIVTIYFEGSETHTDTTVTDERGAYLFEDVPAGRFSLSAVMQESPGSGSLTHVSAISTGMDNTGQQVFCCEPLLLFEIAAHSSITGEIRHLELTGQTYAPVENADVFLVSVSATGETAIDSLLTGTDGIYAFHDVTTGTYCIKASKSYESGGSGIFFCDGTTRYTFDIEIADLVEKPAVYIYPERDDYFHVTLEFSNGADLTESVPEYLEGWNVFVETSGRIDKRYDYLFYEASIPGSPPIRQGWCMSRDDLPAGLKTLLLEMGLNESESDDFLEYWLDELAEYRYYCVYPLVGASLDNYVRLHVDPKPDAVLRFWLFFEGSVEFVDLPGYESAGFTRGPTTVVEWGGVRLN
jgi:hypothetical protein